MSLKKNFGTLQSDANVLTIELYLYLMNTRRASRTGRPLPLMKGRKQNQQKKNNFRLTRCRDPGELHLYPQAALPPPLYM